MVPSKKQAERLPNGDPGMIVAAAIHRDQAFAMLAADEIDNFVDRGAQSRVGCRWPP
ncbi:MAG: hypothetical protein P0107_03205 [Nitrosomonas sp.]|nr:hypothetical protein [Nitrosomonas sp.]